MVKPGFFPKRLNWEVLEADGCYQLWKAPVEEGWLYKAVITAADGRVRRVSIAFVPEAEAL